MRRKDTSPNKTGRSSGRVGGRRGKRLGPPKDEPWVWLPRELLTSPSWQSQSINCRRLIDALLIDHMNHAGTENGNLVATYDQLMVSGASRRFIRAAIDEAEYLGLIRSERGGRWAGSNQPSRYRLTFLPDRDNSPETNDWKRRTTSQISDWKAERAKRRAVRKTYREKQIPGQQLTTTVVH